MHRSAEAEVCDFPAITALVQDGTVEGRFKGEETLIEKALKRLKTSHDGVRNPSFLGYFCCFRSLTR